MPKTGEPIQVDPKELIEYLEALTTRVNLEIATLKKVSDPLFLEVPRHLVPAIGPLPGFKCGRAGRKADDQTLAEIFAFVGDAILKTLKKDDKKKG
jgi:hypothetical protein